MILVAYHAPEALNGASIGYTIVVKIFYQKNTIHLLLVKSTDILKSLELEKLCN